MVNPAMDIHNLTAVGLVSDWGTEADRQALGLTFDNSETPKTLQDGVTARIVRCAYAPTLPTLIVQRPTISEPLDCPLSQFNTQLEMQTCLHVFTVFDHRPAYTAFAAYALLSTAEPFAAPLTSSQEGRRSSVILKRLVSPA